MVGPAPQAQGGVASVIALLLQAGLLEDEEVVFVASHGPGPRWRKLCIALRAWTRYLLWLMQGRAAVLHVHVSSHASFWRKASFMVLARLFRRRIVFQLHGGGFRTFYESRSRPVRWIIRRTLMQADELLCLSASAVAWLRAEVPSTRPHWWPNPVSAALIKQIPQAQTERPPHLLFLGALLPAKGVLELLRAFSELRCADGRARLLIAGTGPQERQLREQVTDLGLDEAVDFLGWVTGEQKLACMRRARLLVLPSHLEQQPMVLLEAMALGTALVATRVGGVPDIVRDGVDGILVEPGDSAQLAAALKDLWSDAELRQSLAQSARARVQDVHLAARVADQSRRLYRELAGGQSRQPK